MAKMYAIDNKLLVDKPEIRIGDKIYPVDDRMKTFEKMNSLLQGSDNKGGQYQIIIEHALGEKAYNEIEALDLSFSTYNRIVILILAAIQDITEEEAECRFQNAAQ